MRVPQTRRSDVQLFSSLGEAACHDTFTLLRFVSLIYVTTLRIWREMVVAIVVVVIVVVVVVVVVVFACVFRSDVSHLNLRHVCYVVITQHVYARSAKRSECRLRL